eukprot:scaffold106_cov123-Cylindrotheca_fusiformis.AAC.9
MMPPSPTRHDETSKYAATIDNGMLAMPTLSKTGKGSVIRSIPLGRPRRRTSSFDSVLAGDKYQTSLYGSDHCIDHSSFNKKHEPPFRTPASESATFMAFTSQGTTSTYGKSSSYIGLQGLLPDGDASDRHLISFDESAMIRRNSSVGLNLDAALKACEEVTNIESLSHPLAPVPGTDMAGRNLDMPILQS